MAKLSLSFEEIIKSVLASIVRELVHSKGLFGRTPKRAPTPAPAGAPPKGAKWSSSKPGAAAGALSGFHARGGATKTWFRPAPHVASSQLLFLTPRWREQTAVARARGGGGAGGHR